jgi:putative ABC transport system permease protein
MIMNWLRHDLRFAIRSLRKSPALAASAVLTLALCVGATTAIFSVVYSVLFRPLPFADPEGLLLIRTTWKGMTSSFSAGNWADVNRQQRSFRYFVPVYPENFNLAGADAPENVSAARVGFDYFAMLGVQPALGRSFLPDEDAAGRGDVVILSDGLWRRRFGADPGVVGRQIRLDGRPHTVIGVMPASMDYAVYDEDLWVPAAFSVERLAMHDEHYLTVLGRLRPGVSLTQARDELQGLAGWLRTNYPKENQDRGIVVQNFKDELLGDYRPRLYVLLGAVGFVLLIACANIANLLLARAAARSRDTAIRVAIGAGRRHLFRQALTESFVLAALGGTLGLLAGYWGVGAVVAFGPEDVPRLAQASVNGPVLAFALGVTLLSGLIFGLAPALRMAVKSPQEALKEGGRGSRAGGRDSLRNTLVVAEIALALMLITGAGLLIRSAIRLNAVDPGFDPAGVVAARVSLPAVGYESPAQVVRAFQRIEGALVSLPGASAAALVSAGPLEGGSSNGLVPEGRPLNMGSAINSMMRLVTPGYFAAMKIRVIRGRGFTADDRQDAPLVMVINETLARQAFPGQDPIGKRVACCEDGGPGGPRVWKEVVGVVNDVRVGALQEEPEAEFYLPIVQAPDAAWTWTDRTMTVVARTGDDAVSLMGPLRRAVAEVDPSLPVYYLETMQGRLVDSLAQSRFSTMLLTAFGFLALLLAAIGVYGVISYGVTQRTQEIGIRMALGARHSDVLTLVVRHGAALAGVGLAVGLVGALALSGLLESLLYQVSPTDPPTFATGMVVLTAAAVLAAALPAWRAARTSPMVALRSE